MMTSQDDWNGAAAVLATTEHVTMPQTPNGSLIVGYLNRSKENNQGEITVSSGASLPVPYPVPAFGQMLSLLVGNWQANNLTITNTSAAAVTPILVQAFGPGIPGAAPVNLPTGPTITLSVPQAAQGPSRPAPMLLRLAANTGALTIVGIVGGPPNAPGQTNAYVIALNAPEGTPPEGYYAVVPDNSYRFTFNWNAAIVYVVNLSPVGAAPVAVTMVAL